MRPSTVRGTPFHHVDASGGQGQRGGEPRENRGSTVHEQFREQGINTETRVNATPYRSERGNPPGARREVLRSTNAESDDHGNQNDPHSNGRSVMLEVGEQAGGYLPKDEPTLDSPVPRHAATFDTGTIVEEDRAHLGRGLEHIAGENNDLRELDGVMSRGILGTSKPSAPETELTLDDEKPETAGAQERSPHNVE